MCRARHQRQTDSGRATQASRYRVSRRRYRAPAVSGCQLRRRASERGRASLSRSVALRGRGLSRIAPARTFLRLRSQSHESVHVALPRSGVAVLQPAGRDRKRTPRPRPRGGGRVRTHRLHGVHALSLRARLSLRGLAASTIGAAGVQLHRCGRVRLGLHGTAAAIRADRRHQTLMPPELDIVIPVYNEGRNIVATLAGLAGALTTPARVLICYDHADDDTLPAIKGNPQAHAGLPVTFVRNAGRGAHSAVMTGFAASTAPFVLMYPADDHTNAPMLDPMMALAHGGCDIVCASRFMPGGAMVGCPPLKAALVRTANFTLRHLARLPATDASNGFRMFSRRVIDQIAVESDQGFCYSIELLVKAHRLGWTIGEVPVRWIERQHGASRFRVLKWLPAYLRWYGYAFATTFLRRPPETVALKDRGP